MTKIDKEVVRLIKEYKIEPSKQLFTEDSLNDEILEWFENIKIDLIDFISSSLQLKEKYIPSFDEYVNANFTQRGNIYFSKCHKSGWFIKKEIEKMYKVEFNL